MDVASVDGGLCALEFLPAVAYEQDFFSFPRWTAPVKDTEYFPLRDTYKVPCVQAVNLVLLSQQPTADLDLGLVEFPLPVRMSTVVINSELDENAANELIKGKPLRALSTPC